ncbi:MAG: response regulator [Pontiellaceae bacterium]|nr:response regulator [Pontiellaceae bacterium]
MTPKAEYPMEPRRLKILVMDDEDIVRAVLHRMLIHFGHEVILSANGEEAISIHQQHLDSGETIDLFIMDLTIPGGMGGLEAVIPLRNQNPKIRVIATSGDSRNAILRNYAEHGFSGSIAKPFEMAYIRDAIDSAMAS